MIRVLHIVTYMGRGGLETMLMNYYRKIDRTKVQFDFLVHREFEADYDEEIRELGGKIYHVSRLIPWSRKYKEELKNFFREHPEYQIVHVHQDCLSSVALQCAIECGVPVRIGHSHNSNQDKNIKYLIKRYYMKKIPRYATDLFACSHQAGQWMFGTDQYQILYNAIDAKKFQFSNKVRKEIRNKLGYLDEDVVIGHVGRFNPQKNHKFLIDIFKEYTKQNIHAKLLLIGDGSGKQKIQNKVDSLEIKDKVIFAGTCSNVNEILQAMDVFVFPSIYEGLGICIVEAQTAGLPCIITDTIPNACIVNKKQVQKLSLKQSASEWAEKIEIARNLPRKIGTDDVKQAGYDINEAVKFLENFYVQRMQQVLGDNK